MCSSQKLSKVYAVHKLMWKILGIGMCSSRLGFMSSDWNFLLFRASFILFRFLYHHARMNFPVHPNNL